MMVRPSSKRFEVVSAGTTFYQKLDPLIQDTIPINECTHAE